MFLIQKFLFFFSLEMGGRITSWYCSILNIAYITVLMMVLNSFDVLNDSMTGFQKFQILMVATCVNFFIYYIFGSMVLTVGILEVSKADYFLSLTFSLALVPYVIVQIFFFLFFPFKFLFIACSLISFTSVLYPSHLLDLYFVYREISSNIRNNLRLTSGCRRKIDSKNFVYFLMTNFDVK